ncbi:uncharacterized protein [Palaemon carinicauda]|uniref:uncharacterized protein n=1 Tax=Palaemon carinicauda TaxID=392227 RepID=UPI0035B5F54B
METLKVAQLREELEARGLPKVGNKSELCQRLSEALEKDGVEVQDFREISTVVREFYWSRHVSLAASRAKLAAKLLMMNEIQAIEQEEAALRSKSEKLRLEADLAEVKAEEKVSQAFDENDREITHIPRIREHTNPDVSRSDRPMRLNSEAPEIRLSGYRSSGGNDQGDLSNKEVMQALISCSLKSLMPKQDIAKFDGDHTKYFWYIHSFEYVFSSQLTNDKERLRYLDLYTTYRPNEVVAGCLHLEASEAYKQARKLLEERYGNLEQIATRCVDKIIKWKDIRENDTEEYDEYSVALETCRNAFSCVPSGIAELQNPKTMRLILSKFPFSVGIHDVELLIRSLDHIWWMNAAKYLKWDPRKNWKLGICFDCLRSGHKSQYCRNRKSCNICNGNHPTLLHRHQEVEVAESERSNRALVVQEEGTHDKIAVLMVVRGGSIGTGMSVVLIRIRSREGREVLTKVFLDNGSSICFVSEASIQTLGCPERKDVKVNVETINGIGEVACSLVSGLLVLDYEGNTCIKLPPVFSASRIPIDKFDVVRAGDPERWPHLQEIYIPNVYAEVGLLIGNNVSRLLKSREVINSTRLHEPYAIRTLLG